MKVAVQMVVTESRRDFSCAVVRPLGHRISYRGGVDWVRYSRGPTPQVTTAAIHRWRMPRRNCHQG